MSRTWFRQSGSCRLHKRRCSSPWLLRGLPLVAIGTPIQTNVDREDQSRWTHPCMPDRSPRRRRRPLLPRRRRASEWARVKDRARSRRAGGGRSSRLRHARTSGKKTSGRSPGHANSEGRLPVRVIHSSRGRNPTSCGIRSSDSLNRHSWRACACPRGEKTKIQPLRSMQSAVRGR